MTKKKSITKAAEHNVQPTPSSAFSPTKALGVSGTPIYGGFIVSVEKNPALGPIARYQTYADIFSNISIVAAGVRYFLNVITKSSWKVQPSNPQDEESVRLAELVESIIHDMDTPWHRVIRKAVMYKFYGFSIQEWTAKIRPDGVIGFQDIDPRPQRTIERWDADRTGKVLGVIQRSPQTAETIYLPREKIVYLVDDSLNDSPEGYGLFRHIVESAKKLRRFEELEGYGYETDLRGVPMGRAPIGELNQLVESNTITAEQRDAILKPMETFITNHIKGPKLGILLDSLTYQSTNEAQTPSNVPQWDLQLLKGGSESLHDIHNAIQRMNGEVARILGVEGLLLGGGGGSGNRGSQALSKDKTDNFLMTVDGALKEIASVYNKDIIGTLWKLNGWDDTLRPTFKPDSIQLRDVQEITNALVQMAQAGAILSPDDEAINEVRDLLGLSRPTSVISSHDVSLMGNSGKENNNGSKA